MEAQRPLFDASPMSPPVEGRSAAEFFAGVGLARMGLERAGWEVAFANDLDPKKRSMYEGHFGPTSHYALEDIHQLAREPGRVPTTLLTHASFPCTDLSLAGGRRGLNAGQSSAFWGWQALLEVMGDRRPPLVLVENVTGFLTSHSGADFRSALVALNDLGYSVDALVVDAAHFVPQSRPRLFVVGSRGVDSPLPLVDAAALAPSPLRPSKLIEAIQAMPDIDWRVAQLPDLPAYGLTTLDSILDHPADDSPQWWSHERAEYLLNQMSERHRETARHQRGRLPPGPQGPLDGGVADRRPGGLPPHAQGGERPANPLPGRTGRVPGAAFERQRVRPADGRRWLPRQRAAEPGAVRLRRRGVRRRGGVDRRALPQPVGRRGARHRVGVLSHR